MTSLLKKKTLRSKPDINWN